MSLYISPIQIPEIAQGFEINIDLGSPGSELYCRILNMTGIEGFKLMFRGKKISHEASLASQGIKDKAKILMMTELKQAPQKTSLETQLEEQTHTAQSVLLSMGYSEIAVEKALNSVGSGYGTVQKAIDWIAANQSILQNLDNLVQFVPELPKEKEQSSAAPLQYVTVPRNEPQIEEITEITLDENELSQAFSWGNNDCGQLGIGSFQNSSIPQNIVGLKGVSVELVECGANHTVYLTRDGDIYYCGRYLIPQVTSTDPDAPVSHKFGDKNKPGILETPIKIRFTQISVGNYHTLAIDSHNRIWSWGRGSEGQLGHSTFNSECYPRVIEKLQPFEIVSIGAGAIHSIAVCSTGEVFGWGKNSVGQLGVGTFESGNKPGLSLIGVDRDRIYSVEDVNVVPMTHVICGSWHTITYNASSQLYYKFGSGREFPRVMDVFLQSGIKVKSIECGDGVTYVLSTMNKLFYMNEPNPYEAGSIDIDDVLIPEQDIVGREIEYIKAGATFILVLTKEGYIYTKGENKRGQLGTADFKDRVRYI
jgi:alpha-tubulin suppressor-like RCC1 family protein